MTIVLWLCLRKLTMQQSHRDHKSDTWAGKASSLAQTTSSQALFGIDHSLPLKRESYFDRELELETKLHHSALSLYGSDPALGGLHSTGLSRAGGPIVTQVAQVLQVPLDYAEDIIGIAGRNIAHIRRTSGAVLNVQESLGRGDEITVEIKGTASEVQTAQQPIHESLNGHKSGTISSIYGKGEPGLSSAYSRVATVGCCISPPIIIFKSRSRRSLQLSQLGRRLH